MEELLHKYANLLVSTGVNLQKKQLLIINSPIECAFFAEILAKEAFASGAGDVRILWSNERFERIRYDYGEAEIFDEFPTWRRDMFMDFLAKGAAVISIHASDPLIFHGVDTDKLLRSRRSSGEALLEYRRALMGNEMRWCVASIPTKAWAKKIFPDMTEDEAIDRLWQEIFKAVHISKEQDAVKIWEKHIESLQKASDFLNNQKFISLEYKNALGTDFRIGLPKGHIWAGGAEEAKDGILFAANMPTEEIFTLPDRSSAEGIVYATKPLNYQGSLIEGIILKFSKGRVVEAKAKKGLKALETLLSVDEGARYLGEVALVPHSSPISQSGILFYNTLFDENASCHLALGKAYPTCLENGDSLSSVELVKLGANDSLVHEDFMIGSEDMEILGIREDGTKVKIFENGNFVKRW